MLEIELTNRLFVSEFIKADKKIALMSYCLQDFSVKCESEKNAFDYQCKHCSAKCFQNHSSCSLPCNVALQNAMKDGTWGSKDYIAVMPLCRSPLMHTLNIIIFT
jgi:hypothetical protein